MPSRWTEGDRSTDRKGRSSQPSSDPDSQSGSIGNGLARWILWPLLKWSLVVSLPFVVLLRGSLYAYHQHWPVWLALLAGFVSAFLVLFLYVTWAYLRLKPEGVAYGRRTLQMKALAVLIALGVFQGYLLLAPDPAHIKSTEAATEYDALHPLLRMSVGTFLLVDDTLLITDLSRHPSDYEDMGLSVNARSLHYRQPDGYVHAFDLRTKGHSWIRNGVMEGYFTILGFRALRHEGTADHLHVALPLPSE